MPKRSTEPWIVEDDEFHPDPRIAAMFADQNARLFVRQVYYDALKKLRAKRMQGQLTRDEEAQYLLFQGYLNEVEQAIIEFNKEEDE